MYAGERDTDSENGSGDDDQESMMLGWSTSVSVTQRQWSSVN
jgi:hypothetical protein